MNNTFKLKNYTTGVPAEKSISEIETLLVQFGATQILKDYLSDGTVQAIMFKIGEHGFKLPANVEGVKKVLTAGKQVRYGRDMATGRDEQAKRTAWRMIKDWTHAQLSLIKSGQAQPEQALLPYMWDGTQTLYEKLSRQNFALEEAPETEEPRKRIIINQ
jgi:hypothetical protein